MSEGKRNVLNTKKPQRPVGGSRGTWGYPNIGFRRWWSEKSTVVRVLAGSPSSAERTRSQDVVVGLTVHQRKADTQERRGGSGLEFASE